MFGNGVTQELGSIEGVSCGSWFNGSMKFVADVSISMILYCNMSCHNIHPSICVKWSSIHGQNFEAGKFWYHQIKFLVEASESRNECVLVTVPHTYAQKAFYSNNGPKSKKVVLSEAELIILNE